MLYLGLTWQAWFTIAIIIIMFAALLFTKIRTEFAFLIATSALYITGILDVRSAYGGLSSESVLVVAMLYVVIAGLTYTGVLNLIVKYLMGTPKTQTGAISRLMVPVALLSSCMTNVTVVALFINVVKMWSKKLGITPSKLLIPLSYASGMGGICTLIGTPPNLIIAGLYKEETGIQLSVLTPTLCGLFCLFIGILSMIAMQKLLPDRKSPMGKNDHNFTTSLKVPSDSPYIGMTVKEILDQKNIDKRNLDIIGIRRFDGEMVSPVEDDEFCMGGDNLIINGKPKDILHLSKLYNLNSELKGVLEYESAEDSVKPVKTFISSFILIAMLVLSACNILPLLTCCLFAAFAMIVCRCCSSLQAFKSINWEIIIIYGCSIALGKAIQQTGIAEIISKNILGICGTNPYVVLTTMCLIATFMTEFISNTAAGAIFYPIAMSSATALGVNPLTFCVALMIAASSSYATPIGSTTHMLVYIPGGYKFSDFFRIGFLMNIIILAANIFITTIIYPFN